MEIIGYILCALIGISLGLIGGGGSILTMPVLVYCYHIPTLTATSYSLFIVGIASLFGAVKQYKDKNVNVSTALLFAASSIGVVFVTRKFLLQAIPEKLFSIGKYEITHTVLTMLLFALLMLVTSMLMIKKKKPNKIDNNNSNKRINIGSLIGCGISVGLMTGLLGVGGGFLIVPVLVIVLRLPMKKAIGTSLFVIAINSMVGFAGDFGHYDFNWFFLIIVCVIAVAGIYAGTILAKTISGEALKKSFGWFVLLVSLFIISTEIHLLRK